MLGMRFVVLHILLLRLTSCFTTLVYFTTSSASAHHRLLSQALSSYEGDGEHRPLIDAIVAFCPTMDQAEHVFHGRGGMYPGCEHLNVDWYPPVWLITSFLPIGDTTHWEIALSSSWKKAEIDFPLTWVFQDRSVAPTVTRLMSGKIPDPHVVMEKGNKFLVQLLKGQNHGLFLDMANGREWVQQNAAGKTVLNMFSYSCSFSVAALKGGAMEVVNIDMARGPLKIGQRNHELNALSSARFLNHDIFKSWGKLKQLGPYDIVICDPPSFQKGSFVAKKDYRKVMRRLPTLLTPGGYALLCLNAPELDSQFILDQISEEAPEMKFIQRLENPKTYPSLSTERALKVLLYQYQEPN